MIGTGFQNLLIKPGGGGGGGNSNVQVMNVSFSDDVTEYQDTHLVGADAVISLISSSFGIDNAHFSFDQVTGTISKNFYDGETVTIIYTKS